MHMLQPLIFAANYAATVRRWVVLVCPPDQDKVKPYTEARSLLASVVPPDAKCSGRTALFSGGGKVSLVSADQPQFVPEGTSFDVVFLGWGGKKNPGSHLMKKWRKAAREVVTPDAV